MQDLNQIIFQNSQKKFALYHNILDCLPKFLRYIKLYGLRTALIKSYGRLRLPFFSAVFFYPQLKRSTAKNIAIIGCGQFAFSTIAKILYSHGLRFGFCMDPEEYKAHTLAKFYHIPSFGTENNLPENIEYVYIASNHASHATYAIECIEKNYTVFIEKPIVVSRNQLKLLKEAMKKNNPNIYFGYNRPFSAAIKTLRSYLNATPFTLTCTVIGHFIEANHWYRNPTEGTRVCGNLGHWIDLAIHLLYAARQGFKTIHVQISYADQENSDDNITVVFTTESNDLITLTLSSREEPFEGINETIIFQQKHIFAKIDDFRSAVFYLGNKKISKKYKPKDVGHTNSILQPFNTKHSFHRSKDETIISTELMLTVMEMVINKQQYGTYEIV